jgi:peptidoglycan-associated lipoprotein
MRHHKLLLAALTVLLAAGIAAGCAKRQLTRSDTDRLDGIAAKIAEAERIGAPDCVPLRELAYAKVELEHARHELMEHTEIAESDVKAAEAAAADLLAKTRACVDARKTAAPASSPAPAPTPPAPAAPVPATPPPASAPAPAAAEETTFQNINFDFDKSFIREDAKPKLQAVADYLKKNTAGRIQVEGHCDERGTSEYNMALGERRAASAKKYLVGLGIDGKRLSTISYGKEAPLVPASNEEAWAKNRRAVFVPQK